MFINPRIDFAFKKIFGSAESGPILVSFLNAILHKGQPIITSVEIRNPYLPNRIKSLKETFLDIRANLDDGTHVIIEMQMANVAAFSKRILYNATKQYATQLELGAHYTELTPVIALTITNFVMFPAIDKLITRFRMREEQRHFFYPDNDLQLVFVELPKFRKRPHQIRTIIDKWLYFLTEAHHLHKIPKMMTKEQAIEKAFHLAQEAGLNPDELTDMENRTRWVYEWEMGLLQARRDGFASGREAGLQAGHAEGHVEGVQNLLWRLIQKRFPTPPASWKPRISKLSLKSLEILSDFILDSPESVEFETQLRLLELSE